MIVIPCVLAIDAVRVCVDATCVCALVYSCICRAHLMSCTAGNHTESLCDREQSCYCIAQKLSLWCVSTTSCDRVLFLWHQPKVVDPSLPFDIEFKIQSLKRGTRQAGVLP